MRYDEKSGGLMWKVLPERAGRYGGFRYSRMRLYIGCLIYFVGDLQIAPPPISREVRDDTSVQLVYFRDVQ